MGRWTIPLDRLAAKAKLDIGTVVRKATFDVFRAVALRSPVDTGRFRANWNVSYGAIDTTTSASTNQTRLDLEVSKAMSLPVGGVVTMANSLAYARRLEYGYSKQAPAGMVRISVREFRDFVRRAVR